MADLSQIKKELWEEAKNGGGTCPCCNQFVKQYRRALNSSMARALIIIRKNGDCWMHVEKLLEGKVVAHDFPMLRHWGLIIKHPDKRDDGSARNGLYRITELGRDFVDAKVSVPSHAVMYNGECLKLEGSTTIYKALGKKFNYEELMRS